MVPILPPYRKMHSAHINVAGIDVVIVTGIILRVQFHSCFLWIGGKRVNHILSHSTHWIHVASNIY